MSQRIDVTDEVTVGSVDDECLPLNECVCGMKFNGWADFVLSIYEDTPKECPECHRKFFFRNSIRVYEVIP